MRMYDIILKKRNGQSLTKQEIDYFVQGYTDGEIPDYQISALLMAIYYQGMTADETLHLTMAMADSGDRMDLSAIHGKKIDKHSTGGVGDKTTLVVGSIVAALNIPVAKMSGRGLGHTGGTIDKLESIPGFSTVMSEEEFMEKVNDIKIALVSQTKNLAPADKKIYALRDVTATVDSMPLIASSIMSKKLASGADAIILDVKTGSGALLQKEEDSLQLAKEMVSIGEGAGRKTIALVTNMDEPLGNAVGNSLEIMEVIDTLNGKGPKDFEELCLNISAYMIMANDENKDFETAYTMAREVLTDGRAKEKFRQFITSQHGNAEVIENKQLLEIGKINHCVAAAETGYVKQIDTLKIGLALMILGGGREKKEDTIDYGVGLIVRKKVGDLVKKGECIVEIYGNNKEKICEAEQMIQGAYVYSDMFVEKNQLIKYVIDKTKIV